MKDLVLLINYLLILLWSKFSPFTRQSFHCQGPFICLNDVFLYLSNAQSQGLLNPLWYLEARKLLSCRMMQRKLPASLHRAGPFRIHSHFYFLQPSSYHHHPNLIPMADVAM